MLVFVSLLVLTGGLAPFDLPARLQPSGALMSAGAAWGLAALGGVLLALEFGWRRATWLAALPVVFGLLALVPYVGGRELHVDELLLKLHLAADTLMPGRASRLSALSLLAAGLCLLWREAPILARRRPLITALLASLMLAIGLAPLLGWLLGLPEVVAWNQVLRPAPLIALCLVMLGLLMLGRAWRDDPDRAAGPPLWLPAPVMAAGVTVTLLFAAALRDREMGFIRGTTQLTINNAATLLHLELDNAAKTLQRVGARWAQISPLTDAIRNGDGRGYRTDFPALRSLTWIDASLHTRWIYPAEGNEHLLEFDHGRDARHHALIAEAQASGQPAFSPLLPLPLGGQGFLI